MRYFVLLAVVAANCLVFTQANTSKDGQRPGGQSSGGQRGPSRGQRLPDRVGAISIADKHTIVTPCGNLTNSRYKYGVITYNRTRSVAQISCARGYTFNNTLPRKTCNKTSNQWVEKGMLSCVLGRAGRCAKPTRDAVGACALACGSDSNCTNNQKCCYNGCGYSCIGATNDGLCGKDNKNARFKKALDTARPCKSGNDKQNWCAGFYEEVSKNCMKIMIKKYLPKFIDKMSEDEFNAMVETPDAREFICSQFDKISKATLEKMKRKMSAENLREIMKCLKEKMTRIRNRLVINLLLKILKTQHGNDISGWPAEVFKEKGRGIILCWIKKKDRKALVKNKNIKDIIKSITPGDVSAIMDNDRCFRDVQRLIRDKFGDYSKWTKDTLESLNNFVVALPPRSIDKIPKEALCGAKDALTKISALIHHPAVNAKIVERVVELNCLAKPLNKLTAEETLKLGYLLCGIRPRNDNQRLTSEQVSFDVAYYFFRCLFSAPSSKRKGKSDAINGGITKLKQMVLKKLKEKKSPSKWTAEEVMKVLHGLDAKTCKAVPAASFAGLSNEKGPGSGKECVNSLRKIPSDLADCLRKKAEEQFGKPSTWTATCLEALRDFTASGADIKAASPATLQRMAARLRNLKETFKKKRLLFYMMKLGNVNLTMIDFLDELPYITIKQFSAKLMEELGMTDDSPGEDQDLQERNCKDVSNQVSAAIWEVFEKDVNTEPTLGEEDIAPFGPLMKAIPPKIIKKLDMTGIYGAFVCFEYKPYQLKAFAARFKELKGELNEDTVCQLGPVIPYFKVEELKKLPIDPTSEDSCSWLEKCGEANPGELGKDKLQEIASIAVGQFGDKITLDNVNTMGSIVLGLQKGDLDKVEGAAVADVLGRVIDNAKLGLTSDDVKEYLLERVRKERGDTGMTSEDACNFAPSLKDSDIKKMEKKAFDEASSCLANSKLKDKATMDAVKSKMPKSSSTRKRRATDEVTADTITDSGLLLDPDEIARVKFSVYDELADEIGQKEYNTDQLKAWAKVAKNGDASKMTPELIKKLGRVCTGLDPDDIGSLDFKDDETIEACSKQDGFTKDQKQKGLEQVKKKKGKSISQFSDAELFALANFAVAMSPDEIASIPKSVYRLLSGTLGALSGWDEDQLVKLKDKAVEVYGPVSSWTAAQVQEANAAVGGLSESEIKDLTTDQIVNIPTNGISQIPPSRLKHYSLDQLKELSPSQRNGFTAKQSEVLPDEMKKEVCERTDCTNKESGSNQVTMGTVTLLLTILVTMTTLF